MLDVVAAQSSAVELRECPEPTIADVIAKHVHAALVAHGLIECDDCDED